MRQLIGIISCTPDLLFLMSPFSLSQVRMRSAAVLVVLALGCHAVVLGASVPAEAVANERVDAIVRSPELARMIRKGKSVTQGMPSRTSSIEVT